MKTFDEIYAFSVKAEGNGTQDHLLCTATAEELRTFIPYVTNLPECSRVVEVGTYTGRSASVYFQVQKDLDLDIHLIDNWGWNPHYSAHAFVGMVVAHFNDVPFTYHKMDSERVMGGWELSIDFLYLDGAHEAPGVTFDYERWTEWVSPGGILAAHDSKYPDIIPCLQNLHNNGWKLLAETGRLTIWEKPKPWQNL